MLLHFHSVATLLILIPFLSLFFLADLEGSLSPEELNRVRIAFAEGFAAGNAKQTDPPKFAKFLKILQQFLGVCLVVGCLIALLCKQFFHLYLQ